MSNETIKIRFGEFDLEEYDFSTHPSEAEPPPCLLEAAYLIGMNKEPGFDLDSIPENDFFTFEEIAYQCVEGVFLLERAGALSFFLSMLPTTIAGLIDVIALDCPGPLMAGVTAEFIDRKSSNLPFGYAHPKLKPILKNSCGIILYRKQVVEIAAAIGGYTTEEQNELRLTLESCKPGDISGHRNKFVDGAVKNWVDADVAEAIFKKMTYFSCYDYYDEWHAAGYAYLAYKSAYMRNNYPEEYQSALDNTRHLEKCSILEIMETLTALNPLISRLLKAKVEGQVYGRK